MSLLTEWVSFRQEVLVSNLPPSSIDQLRKVFAAGAIAMLAAINDSPDIDSDTEADDLIREMIEQVGELAGMPSAAI